jgi:hypothetical protein
VFYVLFRFLCFLNPIFRYLEFLNSHQRRQRYYGDDSTTEDDSTSGGDSSKLKTPHSSADQSLAGIVLRKSPRAGAQLTVSLKEGELTFENCMNANRAAFREFTQSIYCEEYFIYLDRIHSFRALRDLSERERFGCALWDEVMEESKLLLFLFVVMFFSIFMFLLVSLPPSVIESCVMHVEHEGWGSDPFSALEDELLSVKIIQNVFEICCFNSLSLVHRFFGTLYSPNSRCMFHKALANHLSLRL